MSARSFPITLILILTVMVAGVTSVRAATSTATPPTGVPAHLWWAEQLLSTIQPNHNTYGSHPSYTWWAGVDGKAYSANRTVCSSLVTHLFMQAYRFTPATFRSWMGSTEPLAAPYYEAITREDRFQRIDSVTSLQPGDLLASKYFDAGQPKPGGGHVDTGHVMIVEGTPVARQASAPIEPGTEQYDVQVIDSTGHGHGATDSRYRPNGTWQTGIGEGTFRVYAGPNSQIQGYTWSDDSTATYYSIQSLRHLAAGRLSSTQP